MAKARQILAEIPIGQLLMGADRAFAVGLLEHHPNRIQKVGPGLAEVYISTSPDDIPGNHPCFWLIRTDGSRTDFSFRRCLGTKNKSALKRSDVIIAMRHAIRAQIRRVESPGHHVDHVIPFAELAEAFWLASGIGWAVIELAPAGDNTAVRQFADPELAMRWAEFHDLLAVLRVVPAEVNLTRNIDNWKDQIRCVD